MSTVIRGNVRMALASIRRSKARSGFTMFGVVIAVLPVLTILGIGEGVTRQVESQIDQLGSNLITVRPGNIEETGAVSRLGALSGFGSHGTLTEEDLKTVRDLEVLDGVTPVSVVSGNLTVGETTMADALVIGATSDLPDLLNKEVRYGEFFTEQDAGKRFAVLGRGAAEELFNEGAPLGRSFTWRGETFMVRGILERFSVPPFSLSLDFNNAVIIPYQTAAMITGNAPIYELLARPSSGVATDDAQAKTREALLTAHGGAVDFSVLTQTDSLRITNQVLNLLTGLVAAIAAIALLVAGIGIMNIMLVSVAERTQEVGIRKAIGATKQQIMDQFMAEAAVLTIIGSIIGVILAFIGQYFIGLFSPVQPFITWQAVLVVMAVSMFVGLFFGTIPALKAARKDPITALRQQ